MSMKERFLSHIDVYKRKLGAMRPHGSLFAVAIALIVGGYLLNDGRGLQESHSLTTDPMPVTRTAVRGVDKSRTVDQPSIGIEHSTMRLYDRVMEEFDHQDYEAAEAGFRFFLALYPGTPLSTQAQYRLGECAFRLRRYQDAIASFDVTLSTSPLEPTMAAAALMKKGLSYAKLGDPVRARHLLELVVAQFPESDEAVIARRHLVLPLP